MSTSPNNLTPPIAPPGVMPEPHVHEGRAVLQEQYVTNDGYMWGSSTRVLPDHQVEMVTREVDPETLERMSFDPKIHKAKRIRINGVLTDDLIFATGATEEEARSKSEYNRYEMVMLFAERMIAGLDPSTPIWRVLEMMLDGGYEQGHKIAETIWELRLDKPTKSLQTETRKRGARPRSALGKVASRIGQLFGIMSAAEEETPPEPKTGPTTSILNRPKIRLMPKTIKVKPRGSVLFVVDVFMNVLGLIPAWLEGRTSWNVQDVISRDKFMVFVNNPTDDDPRGNSSWRPVYWAWSFKNFIPKEYLRFLLNEAVPVPVLTLPDKSSTWLARRNPDGSYMTDPTTGEILMEEAVVSAARTIADIRTGKGVGIPFGATLDAYGGNRGGAQDSVFPNAIRAADEQIEEGILNQPLAQSAGRSTTQKGTQTHENRLNDLFFWDKRALGVMLLYDLIAVGVRWNLGEEFLPYLPKVSLGDSEKRDWARDLEVISKAYFYGFIDDSMRAELCAWLGLPRPGISRQEMVAIVGKDGSPAPPNTERPDKQPDQRDRNDGNGTPKKQKQLADYDARMASTLESLYERVNNVKTSEFGFSSLGHHKRGRKSFVGASRGVHFR